MNTRHEATRITPVVDLRAHGTSCPDIGGPISPPSANSVQGHPMPARRSASRWTDADLAAVQARQVTPTPTPAGQVRKPRNRPEDGIQRAVVDFWSLAYPDTWRKTFHCPNGLAARNPKLAGIFKGLGMKPGVFDLVCIARRGPYNGFALELKSANGRASDDQTAWAEHFYAEGWFVAVAFSLDVALRAVREYHEHPQART